MKLKQFSWLTVTAITTGLITFSSCKKDNSQTQPADTAQVESITAASQNDASAEAQYDDVFNITMGVQSTDAGDDIGIGAGADVIYGNTVNPDGTPNSINSPRCFSVSVFPNTPHAFPKTITLDFGNGCAGKDGKVRKGKIVTVYTGPMFLSGSNATTTFEGYSVDTFQISGVHTIENISTDNSWAWTTSVRDGKIINTTTGKWKGWNSVKTVIQSQGHLTPLYQHDDVYEITGKASGSNSDGLAWTATITNPLIKKIGCHWMTSGKVQVVTKSITGELNYGEGDCDNKATITINGMVKIITLR